MKSSQECVSVWNDGDTSVGAAKSWNSKKNGKILPQQRQRGGLNTSIKEVNNGS